MSSKYAKKNNITKFILLIVVLLVFAGCIYGGILLVQSLPENIITSTSDYSNSNKNRRSYSRAAKRSTNI